MARKRHHSSSRMHPAEKIYREEIEVGRMPGHYPDKFNDEKRHDRSREMYEYRKNVMDSGFYAGPDPRRRHEMEDAGMIHEDHNAIANLPQNVIMKPYDTRMNYLPEDLDDTIHGVDRQIKSDDDERSEHFYPRKD